MSYEAEWESARPVLMMRVSAATGGHIEITEAPEIAVLDSNTLSVDYSRNRIVLTADNMLLHYEILDSRSRGKLCRLYLGKLVAKAVLQPVQE